MAGALEKAVAAVNDYLREAEFSGAVRISSGSEVLLEHASGLANRADQIPNKIGTRFGIASVTKTFTAAAVCRLVDRGAATFDARVVDVLPAAKRPATLSDAITVHHLLTHTSGIADYYDEVTLGAAAYEQIWLEHPSYLFREPMDFLPLFADLPPLREPGGDVASYCSAGYILLGLVIEELSGKRYVDYVESEIFQPARMLDSGFFALDGTNERTAIGYIQAPDGSWHTNHYAIPVVGGPDGGAFSTVHDLASFLEAISNGALFGDEVWKTMSTPHVRNDDIFYGYGLAIIGRGDATSFGHGGADPGFSARAYRYPRLQADVTMLGNTIEETDPVIELLRSEIGG